MVDFEKTYPVLSEKKCQGAREKMRRGAASDFGGLAVWDRGRVLLGADYRPQPPLADFFQSPKSRATPNEEAIAKIAGRAKEKFRAYRQVARLLVYRSKPQIAGRAASASDDGSGTAVSPTVTVPPLRE